MSGDDIDCRSPAEETGEHRINGQVIYRAGLVEAMAVADAELVPLVNGWLNRGFSGMDRHDARWQMALAVAVRELVNRQRDHNDIRLLVDAAILAAEDCKSEGTR
jgi:hypothetical protein